MEEQLTMATLIMSYNAIPMPCFLVLWFLLHLKVIEGNFI